MATWYPAETKTMAQAVPMLPAPIMAIRPAAAGHFCS
jgi:hypothetical protein